MNPTIIIRHRKENLKKCSLRGLETREDCIFYSYPMPKYPSLSGYIYLTLDAPPLSTLDRDRGLFLIDGTWRYAKKMEQAILPHQEGVVFRSIPSHFRTGYPRKQTDCSDPERGLASVEALYLAYQLMGRDTKGLLDLYYWRDAFLKQAGFKQTGTSVALLEQ